ncbi:uncharacterized protein LOC141913144 [Tubulanus polymorphus]|uniref:uncharacterized protein LOC141913144 n=1 Tax=Tubulanus polymorphus TaxID=672921 RepID=UPI003DA2628C
MQAKGNEVYPGGPPPPPPPAYSAYPPTNPAYPPVNPAYPPANNVQVITAGPNGQIQYAGPDGRVQYVNVQPGQVTVGGQPNVIYVQQQQRPTVRKEARRKALCGMGVVLLICGLATLIINIVQQAEWKWTGAFTGYWAGLFLVVDGVIGISVYTGRGCKNQGAIVALMVVSILTAIVTGIAASVGGSSATLAMVLMRIYGDYFMPSYVTALVKIFLFTIGFIVSIVEASFCCSCCYRPIDEERER